MNPNQKYQTLIANYKMKKSPVSITRSTLSIIKQLLSIIHYPLFIRRFPLSIIHYSLFISLVFQSCIKDNNGIASGAYIKGVFIINEGSAATPGTVSFYNRANNTISNNIYAQANASASTKGPLYSIGSYNAQLYLIGQPGTINIVNPYSFALDEIITDTSIYQPHNFLWIPPTSSTSTNKAYISDWGPGSASGRILIYNLTGKQVTGYIPVGNGPTKMLAINSAYLYAMNSGGNGIDSSLAVINVYADTVLNYIYGIGVNPNSLKADANNDLWVLSDSTNDGNTNAGKLSRLHAGGVDISFPVPKHSTHLTTDSTAHYLYFAGGDGKLYKKDIINFGQNLPVAFSIPGLDLKSPTALDFDRTTGYLFITDAKDKTGPGKLYVIDPNTNTIKASSDIGVNPTSFIFE